MSDITRETVAHLAKLAHIDMTETELQALTGELGAIVESVKSVSEAVTDDIPATSHPIALQNVFRRDIVGQTLSVHDSLSGAPDAAEGKFKVPAILDED